MEENDFDWIPFGGLASYLIAVGSGSGSVLTDDSKLAVSFCAPRTIIYNGYRVDIPDTFASWCQKHADLYVFNRALWGKRESWTNQHVAELVKDYQNGHDKVEIKIDKMHPNYYVAVFGIDNGGRLGRFTAPPSMAYWIDKNDVKTIDLRGNTFYKLK